MDFSESIHSACCWNLLMRGSWSDRTEWVRWQVTGLPGQTRTFVSRLVSFSTHQSNYHIAIMFDILFYKTFCKVSFKISLWSIILPFPFTISHKDNYILWWLLYSQHMQVYKMQWKSNRNRDFHLSRRISVSSPVSAGLTTALPWARVIRIGSLWGPPLRAALRPCFLNHYNQSIVHTSQLPREESHVTRHFFLIHTTDQWRSGHWQLIGFERVDLHINNSLWPRLHLISHGTAHSKHTDAHNRREMQCSNGNELFSFPAPLLSLASYLFWLGFFLFSPQHHLCLLSHSGQLVITFLCSFHDRLAVTHSQSPSLVSWLEMQLKKTGNIMAISILWLLKHWD